jgi:YVTN family beta-propeller protein
LATCLLVAADRPDPDQPGEAVLRRRPAALVLDDDGHWLFAAERGGLLSTLDAKNLTIASEVKVGRSIADLVRTHDGRHLLAADEEAGELIVVRRHEGRVEPLHRLPAGRGAVGVRVAGDHAAVAALWSRQLTIFDLRPLNEDGPPAVRHFVHLPFAPRGLLPLPGAERMLVADAFGGRLAVVDLDRGVVESDRTIPAHNIRGIAMGPDGRTVLVAHQRLGPRATTALADIHWGNLLSNDLRTLTLAALNSPAADLLDGSTLRPLGVADHGGGDPSGLAVGGGAIVASLGGINEVALLASDGSRTDLTVGRRPTSAVVAPDGARAYVANTLGGSITVLDLTGKKVAAEIALGPSPEATAAERGERLFYDARLSHGGWLSCHSCHTDGHTSGQLADTLGDGTYGSPKRVLTLRGVGATGPWAWDGTVKSLEDQVRQSIEKTMQGRPPTAEVVSDLVAFLRTLPPPPPAAEGEANRGRERFGVLGCAGCHAPPTYTSRKAYRVGLKDEAGRDAFNPPSLRGLGQGGPYFHDGRAATLKAILTEHKHQLPAELSPREVEELVKYLRTL